MARLQLERVSSLRARLDRLLVLIVVGAGTIRFVGIGSQSMWYDEVVTTRNIAGGIGGLWARVRDVESSPPLYFALATLWTRLFGDGDAALRSLSALAGTATVAIVYLIVRELGQGRGVARLAALLTAVNPFLVWYSQEARPYALFAFFGALSLLCLARALHRGNTRDLLFFGLAAGATIATHYFGVFLVGPELVVLAVARYRSWRGMLLAMLCIGWVLLLVKPLADTQQTNGSQGWVRGWPLGFRESETFRHFIVGFGVSNALLWRVGGLVLLLATAQLVLRASRSERQAAAVMLFIGAALLIAAARVERNFFLDRNVIVAIVPLVIVVAIGLGVKGPRWLAAIATAAVVGVSLVAIVGVQTNSRIQRADWRGVARIVNRSPGDRVVVMNGIWILGTVVLPRYLRDARPLNPDDSVRVQEIDVVSVKKTSRRCDLWYGNSCYFAPLGQPLPAQFSGTFSLQEQTRVQDFRIDRYTSGAPFELQARSLIADPAQLSGALLFYVPARREDHVN